MTDDKFAPRPISSFECVVCDVVHRSAEEARTCATKDTRSLEVDKVVIDDEIGYPRVFVGVFRTGASRTYASVERCSECDHGETTRGENVFPCQKCNSTGYIVQK